MKIYNGNWGYTSAKINEIFSKDGRAYSADELKAEYDKLRKRTKRQEKGKESRYKKRTSIREKQPPNGLSDETLPKVGCKTSSNLPVQSLFKSTAKESKKYSNFNPWVRPSFIALGLTKYKCKLP